MASKAWRCLIQEAAPQLDFEATGLVFLSAQGKPLCGCNTFGNITNRALATCQLEGQTARSASPEPTPPEPSFRTA